MAVIALTQLLPHAGTCADCRTRFETRLAQRLNRAVPRGRDGLELSDDERGLAEAIAAELAGEHPQGHHYHENHDNHDNHDHAGHTHAPLDLKNWWRTAEAAFLSLSGLLIAVGLLLDWTQGADSRFAYVPAAVIALMPIGRKAVAAARSGSFFSIEMLVSIAAIGAFFIDAVAEAAVVAFLFIIGEMLEGVAAAKARAGIQALADLVPKGATVVRDGQRIDLPIAELVPGMRVEVVPGGRIPCDGTIAAGQTSVDQSPVTGESVPVAKTVGDTVFAGSINADGVIQITVETASADNTIARIIALVEQAEGAKSPTARFIDRFSRGYTPSVTLLSLLVIMVPPLLLGGDWSTWVYRGLTLLLIACPCALVLSTPAAITSALAAGARRGLLMKGGAVLEKIGSATIIAFDKTGTLTEGRPSVTDILPVEGDASALLTLAAAVERGSHHPLATAIVAAATARGLAPVEATGGQVLPGVGVRAQVEGDQVDITSPRYAEAQEWLSPVLSATIAALETEGKTVVVVSRNAGLVGVIALRDEPRADAKAALAALRALGIRTLMLTGDNARTAAAIGAALGIEARGDLLPADKLAAIEELRHGGTVAMVGDGINDAPALARADIGIAMGKGTDIALETADAALLHDRIGGLVSMVTLSRATLRIIRQNVIVALGLKAIFLVTTLLGETGLWMAVLADTGGTVLVTLNALRLLRYRG